MSAKRIQHYSRSYGVCVCWQKIQVDSEAQHDSNLTTWIAFFTASGLLALITLTLLEIVFGVDNVIFISIAANRENRPALWL